MTQQADLALGHGALSEKGRREENQDKMTAFSTPMGMVYLVADGMGGHRGGAEASRLVVEGYQRHLANCPEGAELGELLQHATALTNQEIMAGGAAGGPAVAGMGSTVVMVVLHATATGMEVVAAHVGDSRAYLYRKGALHQITHDHSAVQRMVDEGLISVEAGRRHPDLNVLTRALGKQPEVQLEVGPTQNLFLGDALLLCTDGMWGHLTEERIAHELSLPRSASDAVEALVRLALDAGSDDNVTAQLLRLENKHLPWGQAERQAERQTEPELAVRQTKVTAISRDTQPTGLIPPPSPPVAAVVEPPKKKAWLLPVIVAACVAIAAAGGLFYWGAHRHPPVEKASPARRTVPRRDEGKHEEPRHERPLERTPPPVQH